MDYNKFLSKLKEAGLDEADFSEDTKVSLHTLNGWKGARQGKKTPDWVESWVNMKIENKRQKIIIEELRGLIALRNNNDKSV
ncbi:MAG: XRE family transcriptional regulator [Campylobacterota bacterium]|nr:XRE family transcriptional regulator [Campylobacterota bacterium]